MEPRGASRGSRQGMNWRGWLPSLLRDWYTFWGLRAMGPVTTQRRLVSTPAWSSSFNAATARSQVPFPWASTRRAS